ncbi:MAG: DUF6292 family protein [Labedaea sp.]
MDLELGGAADRGLRRYVSLVAEALDLTGDCWLVQAQSPISVYLPLDEQLTGLPGRDAALLWDEERGWSLGVEWADSAEVRVVAYLGGKDLLPEPAVVAQFATRVGAGSGVGSRPSLVHGAGAKDDLRARLVRYAHPAREAAPTVPPEETLTVAVHRKPGDRVVLNVGGEIDLNNADELWEAAALAMSQRPRLVVIDLSQVRFLGSAGLQVLAEAHNRAKVDQIGLRVVASSRRTLLPLRVTGLASVMAVYPSLDEALVEQRGNSQFA